MPRVTVEEANLLLSVPKGAVIDYLLDKDPEHLKRAYNQLNNSTSEPSRSDLNNLSRSDLAHIFQSSDASSSEDARRIFEEYRYKGMKSIYIYECKDPTIPEQFNIAELNSIISILQADYQANSRNFRFFNLQARIIENINTEYYTISEITYSYEASIHYIIPDNESPSTVRDLRYGFIWIQFAQGWIAVCARDEGINSILINSLIEYLHFDAKRLYIPKLVLRQLEPDDQIRRASLVNPLTGTGRRWTNPNLNRDTDAMREFSSHDQYEERPTSGYNQRVGDINFALGYSNRRGKIYFSRDLTATQMRIWGTSKIEEIINMTRSLRATSASQVVYDFSRVKKGIPDSLKPIISEIAGAIHTCKSQGLSEIPLNLDSAAILGLLGDKVIVRYYIDCEDCQGPNEIRCETCKETSIELQNGQLICTSCQQSVDLEHIECFEGHINISESIADLIYIIPRSNLKYTIESLIAGSMHQHLNANEEYHIHRNQLFFYAHNNSIIHYIDEINEFNGIIPLTVPGPDATNIKDMLGTFDEKCGQSTTENCADCINNPTRLKCYIRLFGLLDSNYTPRPHHGQEYGDYNRLITLGDGHQKQLVVAIKKSSPSKTKRIKRRDTLGRDIYSQIAGYRYNSNIEVIGICVPRKLDDEFKAILRMDARLSGKELLLIDDDDLTRVIYGVMQSRNIALDEI